MDRVSIKRVILSGAEAEKRAKRSRRTSAVRSRAAFFRTAGVLRFRTRPPAPAGISAQDDTVSKT